MNLGGAPINWVGVALGALVGMWGTESKHVNVRLAGIVDKNWKGDSACITTTDKPTTCAGPEYKIEYTKRLSERRGSQLDHART